MNPEPESTETTGEPRSGSPSRPPRQTRAQRRAATTRKLIETRGPEPGAPVDSVRLAVGTIVGTHGVHGELKLRLSTDEPEHFATLKRVYLGDEERPRRLLSVRFDNDQALIRLSGIMTPEEGQKHHGQRIRIAGSDARPLAPGEYFLYQLIGLTAYDPQGQRIGVVSDLMETGAHDVLVITPDKGADILVPNHPEYVTEIDPAAGRLTARVPVYDAPGSDESADSSR